MSRPRPGALLGGILLCHALAFIAFTLYSIVDQPPGLLAPLRMKHAFGEAALLLVETMPALTAAGAMVAYSLFPGQADSPEGKGPTPVLAIVRPALVALLVLTVLYLFASGLAAPLLYGGVRAMEDDSASAADYRAAMELAEGRAKKSGSSADYRQAYDAATRYLELDPENEEMAAAQNAFERAYIEAAQGERAATEAQGKAGSTVRQAEDAVALLRKAQAFYDAADYYSAHYYAGLAQRSAVVRQQAADLAAAAERQISPQTSLADKATTEEIAAAERALAKREAYALYEQGEWVAAFYRFGELSRQYPDDRDVANYLELSREKVLETAFPITEVQEAMGYPGAEGLLFTVDRGQKGLEVISIRKMVRNAGGGAFFADIELLRVTPGEGRTLHLFARYGKLTGSRILLHAVDETEQWRSEEPRVYLSRDAGELTVLLDPGYEAELLSYIRPDPQALRAVPTAVLWRMRGWASRSGLLQEAVDLEIVLFFVRPLLFLSLGLAALAVAWRYRARYYGRPAALAFLSLAAFPFAMSGVWWLLVDVFRFVWGGCLAVIGFVPTVVAAAIAHALLLLCSIVSAARGTVD